MIEDEKFLLRKHAESFVTTFIAKEFQNRWRTLFELSARRWSDLNVAGFWRFKKESSELTYIRTIRNKDLSGMSIFKEFLNSEVIVLRTGHSKIPGAAIALLEDALSDYQIIFEGVICVVESKLAIVIDHDDSVTICCSE